MTTIIDGKQVAASVIDAVKAATMTLENETGVKPGLAVVIVGEDPASHAYVGAKSRMSKECGFKSIQHTLPEETTVYPGHGEPTSIRSEKLNNPFVSEFTV